MTMIIKVYDNVPDHDTVEDAIYFGLGFFHISRNTSIDLSRVSIRVFNSTDALAGHTFLRGDRCSIKLFIHGMSQTEILRTLFHELAHLKQACDGRLKVDEGGNFIFEGVTYPTYSSGQLPHEVEAETLAEQALSEFQKILR